MTPSKEQEAAIRERGRFALIACPGSGKTFTVAERLARRITEWDQPKAGIAALSFTNVAHQQIAQQLANHGIKILRNSTHYLGTLDSFINRWIFLPFGPYVMDCRTRPTIIGLDGLKWDVGKLLQRNAHPDCHGCNLVDFTYDPDRDGELVLASKKTRIRKNCPHNKYYCKALKAKVTAKGYASQTDAAYWALRVLLEFPDIGRALAKRFPEIIIDEAQDTSEAQMRVLDRLCELGLTELMLVGDPDQAIFEWRDAKPEILMAKTQGSLGWGQPLSLRENRRSSQIICNTIIGFSQCRCDGMRAVGDHCNSTILPLLIEYSPSNLGALVDALRSACNCYGLPVSPTTAAILVRGNDLLKQILGFADGLDDWKEPWKDNASSLVARAAFRFSHDQDIGRSMSLLEHALARICFKDRHFTESELRALVCEKIGERQWRSGLYALLKHLPPTDLALRDWVIQTSNLLVTRLVSLGWPVPNSKRCSIEHKKRLPGVRGLAQLPVTSFFRQSTATTDDITVETIHAAKGKTYEAVLYVVSPGQKKGSSGKRVPG